MIIKYCLELTQPFILPRLIKWVPEISGNLVVNSNCLLEVALALRQLNPIHKKGHKVFFSLILWYVSAIWNQFSRNTESWVEFLDRISSCLQYMSNTSQYYLELIFRHNWKLPGINSIMITLITGWIEFTDIGSCCLELILW